MLSPRRGATIVIRMLACTVACWAGLGSRADAQAPAPRTGQSAVQAVRPAAPARPARSAVRIHPQAVYPAAQSLPLPPPSFSMPKNVIPHWEIAPNIPIQPNAVQGNPVPRGWGGVGYGVAPLGAAGYLGPIGSPYLTDSWGDADSPPPSPQAGRGRPGRAAAPAGVTGPVDAAGQGRGSAPASGDSAPASEDEGARRPPYTGSLPGRAGASRASAGAGTEAQPARPPVTLLFKDGRPAMQVQAYALSGDRVVIADPGNQRTIPVSDLDLAATMARNRQNGVDFSLPGEP